MSQRLYRVDFISGPDEAYEWVCEGDVPEYRIDESVAGRFDEASGYTEVKLPIIGWEPEGWREFCLDAGICGHSGPELARGYSNFFWPKTDKIFRSRSSARDLVKKIERWGGRAVILECEPTWEPIKAANARRKRIRNRAKIARLQAEIDRLQEVAP